MTMLQHGLVPSTGGYQIERSLRFNSADSAYLSRTPGSAGNRKTWTVSFWLKKSIIETRTGVCGNPDASGLNGTYIEFNTSDLNVGDYGTSSWNWFLVTYDVFRDPSAWYHFVIAVDTTQATASNRVKIYVNNRQITVFDSATYPSLNADTFWNNNQAAAIGRIGQYDGFYLNGYLTDFYNIGGQQLDPSSFGENDTDTGVWKPKAYTGSYGTNGFKLTFSDNSGTTSTTLGKDTSGNGNNWTPNNFSVTAGAGNDSLVDTPTPYGTDTGAGGEVRGNYATWNPVASSSYATLSNGNLDGSGNTSADNGCLIATIGNSSGKWYWEETIGTVVSDYPRVGGMLAPAANGTYPGRTNNGVGYRANGLIQVNASTIATVASFTTGDVIGMALDVDNLTLAFYKNNTLQYTATGLPAGTYFPGVGQYNGSTSTANFGQRPFAYTAPSGFKALCTTNLPTPTIGATSSTRAGKYFNTVLYTGNNSTQSITGVGFQPDLIWIKGRSQSNPSNNLIDAVRGNTKYLFSNLTVAEETVTDAVTAFNSDGFSLGANATGVYPYVNFGTGTFVAWNWKANGSGSTNTAGSITSTVSANTTAGFSIVTFTGNGTAGATVGHGLGAAPRMIIVKSRGNARNWLVYHASVGATQFLQLDTTIAATSSTTAWNDTAPSSTVFTLGTSSAGNESGITRVAYCFAPVAGYSAFGSYTGNGSMDGPFVYTGFRPAFIMRKNASAGTSGDNWYMQDVRRKPYNVTDTVLAANQSYDESAFGATNYGIDILSNGFKIRDNSTYTNNNGSTYIYAAFAEVPAKFSLAR